MINPGSRPLENTSETLAKQNLQAFLAEFAVRGGRLDGDPAREPGSDDGGRYGWRLPLLGGQSVLVLMSGVELERLTKDRTAEAPCLRINGSWAWWNGAVDLAIPLEPGRYAS